MSVINTYDNQNNVVTIPTPPTTSQGVPIQPATTGTPTQGVQGSQPVGGATTPPNNIWATRQRTQPQPKTPGKTVEQRYAEQEAQNQQGYDAFLNAAATDALQRGEQQQQMQQYQQGVLPNASKDNRPVTAMEQLQSDNRQNPAWGANPRVQGDALSASQPTTFDAFRRSLYDEDKIRRQSDTRAKVMALGDAIRHIGNLGFTMAGATPQTFKDAPATQERADYEQGKQLRDQYAYQRWSDQQKRDIAAAEQARKDLELKWNIAGKQADIEFKNTQTGKLLQEIGYNEKNYPIQLQKSIAEYNNLVAQGRLKEAQANLEEIKAKWLPKEKQSLINRNNAAAAASRSTVNVNSQRAALLKKQNDNYESDHSFEVPNPNDPSKNYLIRKENKGSFDQSMRGLASRKGWKASAEEGTTLLDLAYDHLDDPDVVALLERMSHGSNKSTGRGRHSLD